MEKSAKGIKKRIFLSHISIILISAVLTSIVFNIALNIYIRYQTRSQLISAAEIVQSSMNAQLTSEARKGGILDDKEELKSLLNVNKVLKQTQTFLNIKYAAIGANDKIIFPKTLENEDKEIVMDNIIPSLRKKNSLNSDAKKNRVVYFAAQDKSYASFIHPIISENNRVLGNLVLYSDMKNSKQLKTSVNLILLCILIITTIFALIFSNTLSERISRPILRLNSYAKKIGKRNYKSEILDNETYEIAEIGELARTMKNMAQELFAYDNTIKTFLQNASHELRTPLMSIQGYAEGIQLGVIEDKTAASQIIIDESKRLTAIVEDLLYLSKLDTMQETIKLEKIKAQDFLKECIDRVKGIAINRNINIILEAYEDEREIVADEEKLSRAVINILGNCLRYAESQIKIILEFKGECVEIVIEDDGPGFECNELQNVFDRFFKGKGGKYGLGLSIAKTIIEKHNGTITAENKKTGGACFRINFPQ